MIETIFDAKSIMWFLISAITGGVVSYFVSKLTSPKYMMIADIITIPSFHSRFSNVDDCVCEIGYTCYDTYIVLKNMGSQTLKMKDFAPLNMPHIIIIEGKLQQINKPYYILSNPDPFAMYNNVTLNHKLKDGIDYVYIKFDMLKPGQSIEIVVHSLCLDERKSRIRVAVAATLIDGRFYRKKQLMAKNGLYLMFASMAIVLLIIIANNVGGIASFDTNVIFVGLAIWCWLLIGIVDIISYLVIRKKIIR